MTTQPWLWTMGSSGGKISITHQRCMFSIFDTWNNYLWCSVLQQICFIICLSERDVLWYGLRQHHCHHRHLSDSQNQGVWHPAPVTDPRCWVSPLICDLALPHIVYQQRFVSVLWYRETASCQMLSVETGGVFVFCFFHSKYASQRNAQLCEAESFSVVGG